jgi:hypothetical protein
MRHRHPARLKEDAKPAQATATEPQSDTLFHRLYATRRIQSTYKRSKTRALSSAQSCLPQSPSPCFAAGSSGPFPAIPNEPNESFIFNKTAETEPNPQLPPIDARQPAAPRPLQGPETVAKRPHPRPLASGKN